MRGRAALSVRGAREGRAGRAALGMRGAREGRAGRAALGVRGAWEGRARAPALEDQQRARLLWQLRALGGRGHQAAVQAASVHLDQQLAQVIAVERARHGRVARAHLRVVRLRARAHELSRYLGARALHALRSSCYGAGCTAAAAAPEQPGRTTSRE